MKNGMQVEMTKKEKRNTQICDMKELDQIFVDFKSDPTLEHLKEPLEEWYKDLRGRMERQLCY